MASIAPVRTCSNARRVVVARVVRPPRRPVRRRHAAAPPKDTGSHQAHPRRRTRPLPLLRSRHRHHRRRPIRSVVCLLAFRTGRARAVRSSSACVSINRVTRSWLLSACDPIPPRCRLPASPSIPRRRSARRLRVLVLARVHDCWSSSRRRGWSERAHRPQRRAQASWRRVTRYVMPLHSACRNTRLARAITGVLVVWCPPAAPSITEPVDFPVSPRRRRWRARASPHQVVSQRHVRPCTSPLCRQRSPPAVEA